MTEESAFLDAIAAAPEDDAPRLVYADWLDEHGEPERAAFLRTEARLRGLLPGTPEQVAGQNELVGLAAGLDVLWLTAVCRVPLEAEPVFQDPRRCPLNAPGPFYTRGECMACEAPEAEAPDLLAPLTATMWTTHFVRQPVTADEIRRACLAAEVCCVSDVRYGGTDPRIIAALGPEYCDLHLARAGPTEIPADPARPGPPTPRPGLGRRLLGWLLGRPGQ